MPQHIEVSVRRTIAAPIEQVWELTCDLPRTSEWVEASQELTHCSRPTAALGVTYSDRVRSIGPLTTETSWEIIEFRAPHLRVHRGDDVPLTTDMVVTIALEATREGTVFDYSYRWTPAAGPVGFAIGRWLRGATRAGMERSLLNVERLLVGPRAMEPV